MIQSLPTWKSQHAANTLSHNDVVRLLGDANEQIDRLQNELHEQVRAWSILVNRAENERDALRAALADLLALTDEILDVDGPIAQALPQVHYPVELMTEEQCARRYNARRVLGEVKE